MPFTVIMIAPELVPEQRRRAVEPGPDFIEGNQEGIVTLSW